MSGELLFQTGIEPAGESAKALAAYYTDAPIADFLVWWAIRSPQDTAMDPSFGGGAFLQSACKRLIELGGVPARQVFGVEIDPRVHSRTREKIAQEFQVRQGNLILSDFFGLTKEAFRQVDAVVGNPPFIRYQRFCGDARKRALTCARREGVQLSRLSSSWAPFLVHGIAMLKQGGRLAMVLPAEIGYARYSGPVLEHLFNSFGQATFLTFRRKLAKNQTFKNSTGVLPRLRQFVIRYWHFQGSLTASLMILQ